MRYDAVLTEQVHEKACALLLKHAREGQAQEELSFALWRPSTGATRQSALIFDIIPPAEGERHLHGNASFEPGYLTRAIRLACVEKSGLAFMHNHLAKGWQEMSPEDEIAERDRISPPARACGLPLVGLTLGTDGGWSARFWTWDGRRFKLSWCDKVRVAGRKLRITFNDRNAPPPRRRAMLRRTIDTWGETRQRDLARLRVGVVGVGSVGSMVAEALARIGTEKIVLIDPDRVETHNIDRLLHAGRKDIGKHKVELTARCLKTGATAENFNVSVHRECIQRKSAYLAALDCDVLFSAVDRPLPKDLLNRIAYAHCIPVIFGGVFVDNKPDGSLGQAAWSVVTAGPDRRCLRCDGQYNTSDVALERDGSLDKAGYVRQATAADGLPPNQNVFPFSANLASFMIIEMVRLVAADDWWPDVGGKLHYSVIPSRLHTEQGRCSASCSVSGSLTLGDLYRYPFLSADKSINRTSRAFLRPLGDLVSLFPIRRQR